MIAPLLVGITGGSGAGKSSVAAALVERFGAERAVVLAQDAYYLDHSDMPAELRATLNYDVPDAWDRELILEHLHALRQGQAIAVPTYTFATHTRDGDVRIVEPREIVIVEGLTLFVDHEIRSLFDVGLYIDASEATCLSRRVARDTRERGRTPDDVRRQWHATVYPAHVAHVAPCRSVADHVIPNMGRLDECVAIAAAHILEAASHRAAATFVHGAER